MKKFRFILFGKVKEFHAPKNDFVRKLIVSCPQLGKLKLSDLKDLMIIR